MQLNHHAKRKSLLINCRNVIAFNQADSSKSQLDNFSDLKTVRDSTNDFF